LSQAGGKKIGKTVNAFRRARRQRREAGRTDTTVDFKLDPAAIEQKIFCLRVGSLLRIARYFSIIFQMVRVLQAFR
jgi:hypothetical protein